MQPALENIMIKIKVNILKQEKKDLFGRLLKKDAQIRKVLFMD